MPEIDVSDSTTLTASLKLPNNSPMGKSLLSHLNFLSVPVIHDFQKPLNQVSFKEVAFGASVKLPATLLDDGAKLTVKTGASGSISIAKNPDKNLFGDDQFSPQIPIGSDECWLKVELDTTLEGKVAGKAEGIGLSVDGTSKVGLATYSLVRGSNGVFPTLATALETAFENFSVTRSAQAVRAQKTGTVNTTDAGGSLKFTASYSVPLSVSPLASADLPFNYKIKVQPQNTLKIGGELALTGDFIVRCHKVSSTEVELGVYKKRGVSVQASFTASTGVTVPLGAATAKPGSDAGTSDSGSSDGGSGSTADPKKDVLSAVLGAVIPGVDLKATGIDGPAAKDLSDVIKDSIDHHLAISVNAQFTEGLTDEAAVVYKIDLSSGDGAETDRAIASALRGDWTPLATLQNARRLRNVLEDTRDTRHKLRINLLGIYNAETLETFTRSCTILHDDEAHQITITDKVKASRISVAGKPLASDAKKLKSALAEAFLATATYAAASGAAPGTPDKFTLAVSQTYLRFADAMSCEGMRKELLLGVALGKIDNEYEKSVLSKGPYRHARIEASTAYDSAGAQRIFFADVGAQSPREKNELEALGRGILALLIDSSEDCAPQRIAYLSNQPAWEAMSRNGSIGAFGSLAELSTLTLNERQLVAGDWFDITTWAAAVSKVGPALRDVLTAAANPQNADPSADQNLTRKRKALGDMLSGVAHHCRAAFAEGWGLAVTSDLLGSAGTKSFDVVWDGNSSTATANLPATRTAAGS